MERPGSVPQLRLETPDDIAGPTLDTWPSQLLPLPEVVTAGWRLCALDASETSDCWGLVAGVFRYGEWVTEEPNVPSAPIKYCFRPDDDKAYAVLWGAAQEAKGWTVLWTHDCSRSVVLQAPHDPHNFANEMADGRTSVCIIGGTSVIVGYKGVASIVVEGKRATQIQLPGEIEVISSMRYHSGEGRLAVADIQGYVAIVDLELVTPQLQQRGLPNTVFRPAAQLSDNVVRDYMSTNAWSAEARHDVLVLELPQVLDRLLACVQCRVEDFSIVDMMWAGDAQLLHILLVKKKRGARPPHAAFGTLKLNHRSVWESMRILPLGVTISDVERYPFGAEGNLGAGYFEGFIAGCFDANHILLLGRCNGGQVLNCTFCPGDGQLKDDICPCIDADVDYMKMNRWAGPHCEMRTLVAAPGFSPVGLSVNAAPNGLTTTPCLQFEMPELDQATKRFVVASEGFMVVAMAAESANGAPIIQASRSPGHLAAA